MRVVVLTDDHPPLVGGVSVFTERVCAELARRGHDVHVFARWRRDLRPIPGTRLTGVWGPRFSRLGGRWLALRARPALARADLVIATTWPVATGLRRPFAVVAHGSDVTRPPRDPRAFDAVWGAAADRLAMSGFLAARVGARVLPAPVPVPADVPAGPRSGWVCVARATPLKGGDRFVRWVAAAGEEGHLVGDGPELPRWRALAAELGARVTFHGALDPQATLARIARSALCVLAPRADADGSGAEGFGLALVEAAALGVPGAGTAVGGVPEALGPGLVIPAPEDAHDAGDRLRSFLAREPGQAARAWAAAHHGIERTVAAILGEEPSV